MFCGLISFDFPVCNLYFASCMILIFLDYFIFMLCFYVMYLLFHHSVFYFLPLFLFTCLALFVAIGSHSVYIGIIGLLLTLFIEQVWPFHSFYLTPIDLFLASSYLHVWFLSEPLVSVQFTPFPLVCS